MGFFDSFKKKKDDFGLPPVSSSPGLGEPPLDSHSTLDKPPIGTSLPGVNNDVFSNPGLPNPIPGSMNHNPSMPLGQSMNPTSSPRPTAPSTSFPNHNQENPLKHDFELLSSKLDYLKASIEAVNQRLANIEHLVRQEQNNKKW